MKDEQQTVNEQTVNEQTFNEQTGQKQAPESSYTKGQRMLALLGAGLLAALALLLIVLLITGGSEGALLAVLFCLIVLPCVFYIIIRYAKHTTGKGL